MQQWKSPFCLPLEGWLFTQQDVKCDLLLSLSLQLTHPLTLSELKANTLHPPLWQDHELQLAQGQWKAFMLTDVWLRLWRVLTLIAHWAPFIHSCLYVSPLSFCPAASFVWHLAINEFNVCPDIYCFNVSPPSPPPASSSPPSCTCPTLWGRTSSTTSSTTR